MSVTEDKGSQIDACLESYDVISLSSETDSRRSSGTVVVQASPRPRRVRGRIRAFSSVVHRTSSIPSVDFGTSQRHAVGHTLGRR